VPKPVKVVVWILAFALAAGVGAFVASRSNPFPPGVEDPGARPTPTETVAPSSAAAQVWGLHMTSRTQHRLHEGGACSSDWTVKGALTATSNGSIEGQAVATLAAPAACDFSQVQVQTKRLGLDVVGALRGSKLRLTFTETLRSPVGSQDLGGFVGTLGSLTPTVNVAQGRGAATLTVTAPDGDLGSYVATNKVQLVLQ
jgi:hypothetical protein